MLEKKFDKIADSYENALPKHVLKHYFQKRNSLLDDFIKPGDKVLDVGCGTGKLVSNLSSKKNFFKCGCDNSLGMLNVHRKSVNFKKVCCGCRQLPFYSDAFDLVISIAVTHHLTSDYEVAEAIREMIRVTKKGGKIVIWDANHLNPYWLFLFKKISYDEGVESPVKLSKVILEAKRNNISGIRVIKSGWIPDFTPEILMPFFKLAEYILEKMPVVNLFSAHNIVILNK